MVAMALITLQCLRRFYETWFVQVFSSKLKITHQWYVEKFHNYPKQRKALVLFVLSHICQVRNVNKHGQPHVKIVCRIIVKFYVKTREKEKHHFIPKFGNIRPSMIEQLCVCVYADEIRRRFYNNH
ncbi:uncharacterized protein LOC11176127 [Anopheles gambiae]|uniref:uncharacterized protein LOC11176127 n=1 Tax=Anopheles gambiae TaxID=7165 RepID=UPI002AC9E8CB|nr:uncharacterized protein LOC11176127 [Anopheles gambiae]